MKLSAISSGLLAALVPFAVTPSTAVAQSVGDFYWGLFGGAQFYTDNDINNSSLEFDPGWVAGGQLGYIFGSVRAEAEIEYNEADVSSLGNDSSVGSTFSAWRGTGSLYFDMVGFTQSNILPYVGAGLGLGALEFSGNEISDSKTGLTAHGEIGISFATATNFDVVVAYRYEWFDTDVGSVDSDITAHQIRAGIRFFQ
jgi:opacity protein-like surface antigen